jgi:LPXTG-motif cell wall-anchored protein
MYESSLLGLLAGVLVSAGLLAVGAASPAIASTAPFTDQYSNGTLTLCNYANQPITAGRISDKPFVWRAVSSSPAPEGYTRAYLLLYQPLQYVDPSNWTGYQLTDVSTFSNKAHPIAQATYADNWLLGVTHSMPPHWDGLYEVRMYFTTPGQPEVSSPYPSAVIRVTGTTWTLETPENASCNSGTAVAVETLVLPKKETVPPTTLAPVQQSGGSQSTQSGDRSGQQSGGQSGAQSGHSTNSIEGKTSATTTARSRASGTTATTSSSRSGAAALPASASGGGSKGGGGSGWGIGLPVLIGLAIAGLAGWLLLRRRNHRQRQAAAQEAPTSS